MQKLMISFLIFLVSINLKAEILVYFFEYRLPNGEFYSFDENGRFYHTAMKYSDQILEAHPYFGVRLVSDVTKVGKLVVVLRSEDVLANFDSRVAAQLGKKFELYSPWEDDNSTQCSKLIGQIIGVSPVITSYGNLSLSPDLLFAELKKRGFTECQSCLLQK